MSAREEPPDLLSAACWYGNNRKQALDSFVAANLIHLSDAEEGKRNQ
jgi:hypothetical protein